MIGDLYGQRRCERKTTDIDKVFFPLMKLASPKRPGHAIRYVGMS